LDAPTARNQKLKARWQGENSAWADPMTRQAAFRAPDVLGRRAQGPPGSRGRGQGRLHRAQSHNWELIKLLIRTNEFDAALTTYNIASREVEEEAVKVAEDYDVGLFVMKVFGNGRLLEPALPGEDRKPTGRSVLGSPYPTRDFPSS